MRPHEVTYCKDIPSQQKPHPGIDLIARTLKDSLSLRSKSTENSRPEKPILKNKGITSPEPKKMLCQILNFEKFRRSK